MTYSPVEVAPCDPVFISSLGPNGIGNFTHSTRQAAPASGAYDVANRGVGVPFWLNKGYEIERWWWLNGATASTDYLTVCIYDETLDLIATSPRTLSAGTNAVQYANCGVVGTQLINNDLVASQTSYTTASVTLKRGVLYLIGVLNMKGSTADVVSSITGGGTWTSRSTTTWDGSDIKRTSIWSCVPTEDYTGTLVIDFGGNTQTGCGWTVNAFYGADTATNDGIVQNAINSGLAGTTASATLGAFGSANNATFAVAGNDTSANFTPEAGYLELSDNSSSTFTFDQAAAYRSDNDTSPSMTLTAADWGICAVEIKAATSIALPQMRGWLGLTVNGTTATVFRLASNWLFAPVYFKFNGGTTGLPPTLTLTAGSTATEYIPVFGFTRRSSP